MVRSSALVLASIPSNRIERALSGWLRLGWVRPIDDSFARFIESYAMAPSPLLRLTATLVSHQLGRGHPCLDLTKLLKDPDRVLALPPDSDSIADSLDETIAKIRPCALLSKVEPEEWLGAIESLGPIGDEAATTPLVRVGSRLYFRRYRDFELAVNRAIANRTVHVANEEGLSGLATRSTIEAVFGAHQQVDTEPDWQKIACAIATRYRFAVITGGPGTGKTTTVLKLLAVLQALATQATGGLSQPLRIALAAPTGKAAARLNQSISQSIRELNLSGLPDGEAVRAAIPSEVVTLHRLLGAREETYGYRYHRDARLPIDILVVDEASMIDLEMMAATCAALPPEARLILIGDKDQLASVEAGAVLGNLCARADSAHYTRETAAWISQATGESIGLKFIDTHGNERDQTIVKLRTSHRFKAQSAIAKLAQAANEGDAIEALQLLGQPTGELERLRETAETAAIRLSKLYNTYLRIIQTRRPAIDADPHAWDQWASQIMAAFSGFRLLAAVRRGDCGVAAVNRLVQYQLQSDGLIAPSGEWYEGRPVMVTRNDHSLNLMNGDTGIALSSPVRGDSQPGASSLRVVFPGNERSGLVRWILPARLRSVETAFAMTVHKAQGSEFEHVALILPERWQPLLSRELLYTAITRARSRFTLVDPPDTESVVERMITTPSEREY